MRTFITFLLVMQKFSSAWHRLIFSKSSLIDWFLSFIFPCLSLLFLCLPPHASVSPLCLCSVFDSFGLSIQANGFPPPHHSSSISVFRVNITFLLYSIIETDFQDNYYWLISQHHEQSSQRMCGFACWTHYSFFFKVPSCSEKGMTAWMFDMHISWVYVL